MTRTNAAVSGLTLVMVLVAIAIALPRAHAGAPAKPAGTRQGGAPDATAALFTAQCSGCHGTDLAAPWLASLRGFPESTSVK
jgi:mono/diheme cytochrome c family protein